VDDKIKKLIAKHEVGDNSNFREMSTHVFRQLNGNDNYNRVDKISLNCPHTIKAGKTIRTHGYADSMKVTTGDEIDDFEKHCA
jgi:hypothetical protein